MDIQSINARSYCHSAIVHQPSQRSVTMSRLSVPNLESDAGPSGQVYAQIKKAIGSVPNTFAAIAAYGPAALKAVLAADTVVAAGTLTKRDQETIKLVISGVAGCDYCVAAHNHLAKLAQSSGTVSDEDFAAIKAAGYSDAQLVEISLAFATTVFTNVFNRINDTEIDFPAVA